MEFLTAGWKHLILANYIVDPDLVRHLIPTSTNLDLFQGNCFISLVAFLFDNTSVLHIPVPFHRKFEEVNLRFYVTPNRDPSLRAVTFIKEIVPKRAIPLIANNLFHENYVAMPMSHSLQTRNGAQEQAEQVEYVWGKSLKNRFVAKVQKPLELPASESLSEFITEHYWGYAKTPNGTLEYRVKHPKWVGCTIDEFQIDVDFEQVYGSPFGILQDQKPANVLYALGSSVSVSFPTRLN